MIRFKANTFVKIIICSLGIFMQPLAGCQNSTGKQDTSEAYILPEGVVPKNVPVGKLKAVMNAGIEDVHWIDVRTSREIAEGSIAGAIKIDFKKSDFQQKILELDTTKTYYVYCRSGRRSDKARNFMVNHGFRDVYNVKGGILEWKNAGYPLVKEAEK